MAEVLERSTLQRLALCFCSLVSRRRPAALGMWLAQLLQACLRLAALLYLSRAVGVWVGQQISNNASAHLRSGAHSRRA